ncbi:MAG: hypothetical protein MUF68_00480 [Cyclobacteriaceae bacterium]|jgi:hypothetical protein|nr:hypothetical protein [Cyclobacteriaceae bacterium]
MTPKILFCVLSMSVFNTNAQVTKQTGLYLTHADYCKNNIARYDNEQRNFIKIKVTNGNTLIVKNNQSKTHYKFGDVAGFISNGVKYRTVPRENFFSYHGYAREVEKGSVIIYTIRSMGYKNTYTQHFYSLSDSAQIKILSIKNLEEDFKNDPTFIQKIKVLKKKESLTQKNDKGMFKLNELLNERPLL